MYRNNIDFPLPPCPHAEGVQESVQALVHEFDPHPPHLPLHPSAQSLEQAEQVPLQLLLQALEQAEQVPEQVLLQVVLHVPVQPVQLPLHPPVHPVQRPTHPLLQPELLVDTL